jgi:hypothetical protein
MIEGSILMQLEKQNSNKSKLVNETVKEHCVDPSPEQRSKYLLEMNYLFKDTAGILDLAPIKEIYSSIIYEEGKETEIDLKSEDRLECSDNLDLFRPNDFKLCPSHQVLKVRENMHPSMKSETKCNCEKCLQLGDIRDDVVYKCLPVKILMPALIRTNECIGGYYRWKPILEKNSVACICSQANSRIEVSD